MAVVNIEPTNDHPVPYDDADEIPVSPREKLAIAGNTVEAQVSMGATLDVDPESAKETESFIEQALKQKKLREVTDSNTAFAAAAFLRSYGEALGLDVAAARAAITNKLMEIANCGDPKFELKALELLGKHSDIGLFTDRSEVTINYKTPEALEDAIKERVKRLLNADIVDITPVGVDLDEELGVLELEAEDKEAKKPDVEPVVPERIEEKVV